MKNFSLSRILARQLALPAHSSMISPRRVRRLAELISSLLPEQELAGLDIGCGSGEISKLIMDLRSNIRMRGSDLIVRPGAAIEVVQSSTDKLPFDDQSFDFVMMIDVLHHTDNPGAILREAARVSQRFILIKDHFCQNPFDRIVLTGMDWAGNRAHDIPMPCNYLSKKQWQELYVESGLSVGREISSLELYSKPLTWIFDRNLHFINRLEKVS